MLNAVPLQVMAMEYVNYYMNTKSQFAYDMYQNEKNRVWGGGIDRTISNKSILHMETQILYYNTTLS